MNEKQGELSIEHSHTIRRCSVTTTDGRERSQTRCKAFGIGTELIREYGRKCSSEISKDSKDYGEFHEGRRGRIGNKSALGLECSVFEFTAGKVFISCEKVLRNFINTC